MRSPWVAGAVRWACAATALRLIWPLGLELYGDEAYYYLWSRRPAFGYFDHPPLVAWLAALGHALGHREVWLRLPFAVCGGLAVFFSVGLAVELTAAPLVEEDGPRAAWPLVNRRAPALAGGLAALAPLPFLTSALVLPDGPLTAAVAGASFFLLRALRTGATGAFLAAGACAGLALLAKYSALTLAPGLLALLLWEPALRRASWRPWAGFALALAIFLPCWLWNAQHDFVSLRFQWDHGIGDRWDLRSALAFLGTEAVGAGPLSLLGLLFLLRATTPAAQRLALLTWLPLLWFGLAALRGRFEANWPVLLDPALCAAAAAALSQGTGGAPWRLAVPAMALCAAALGLAAVELKTPHLLSADDVAVGRFHQGRGLAAAVAAELPPSTFLFTWSYQDAGELAFYGGFSRFGSAFERPSQLDLWNALPAPGERFATLGPPTPPDAFTLRLPNSGNGRSWVLFEDGRGRPTRQLTFHDEFTRLLARDP